MATAKNTNEVLSQEASQDAVDANVDVSYVGLWTESDGGTFLWGHEITTNLVAIALGEKYRIPPEDIVFTQTPDDGETPAMAVRALNGRIEGILYVSWHDGDPGTTGANEVETHFPRVEISDWTVTE